MKISHNQWTKINDHKDIILWQDMILFWESQKTQILTIITINKKTLLRALCCFHSCRDKILFREEIICAVIQFTNNWYVSIHSSALFSRELIKWPNKDTKNGEDEVHERKNEITSLLTCSYRSKLLLINFNFLSRLASQANLKRQEWLNGRSQMIWFDLNESELDWEEKKRRRADKRTIQCWFLSNNHVSQILLKDLTFAFTYECSMIFFASIASRYSRCDDSS